jgi:hypothetical protein
MNNEEFSYRVLRLDELLAHLDEVPRNYSLYAMKRAELAADTLAAALDPNDSDDPDTDPQFAIDNQLAYVVGTRAVRSVIANAEQQLGRRPTLAEVLSALNFYVKNDAFKEFGTNEPT